MESNQHVSTLIIGAGISGLTAAFHAKRSGQSIRVVDEDPRAGGVIRTEIRDKFLLEFGPNTVLPNEDIMEMIENLGLLPEMQLGSARLTRYIQLDGVLHPVPMSLPAFLFSRLLSARGKLRLFAEPLIRRRRDTGDETLLSFVSRRLGAEAAGRVFAPYVSGVWAGDPSALSAEASFPKLAGWERDNGSIAWGMASQKKPNSNRKKPPRGLLSFQSGLTRLTDSLGNRLGADLYLHTRIDRISREDSNRWRISGSHFSLTADRIIFSTPAWETARLISPLFPPAAEALNQIFYAPLIVLHWALKKSEVEHPLQGFGYLIAPSERLETLGCLWNSSIFPGRAPDDSVLMTVFIGGSRFPHVMELADQEIMNRAVAAVSPRLGFKKYPQVLSLTRYDRSIPQYTVGHMDRMAVLKKAEAELPGIRFAGNYIGGISVGDVVSLAKNIALNREVE